jgi:AraC-like DNA-binding protein
VEKYAIGLADKEMYFYYFNDPHNENTWKQPVNVGYYKINFFVSVDARIVIRERQYFPRKYDFLSYPLYTTHYGLLNGKQNVEYFEFLIPEGFFAPLDADGEMTGILERITEKKYFSLPGLSQSAFVEKIYGMRDMLREGGGRVYVLHRILDLLFDIEKFSENKNTSELVSKPLVAVISYIKENIESVHSVKEICDAMKISRAYLTGLFRREIGCTPYEYLIHQKLEHSVHLLNSGKNVTEACFASGFNSCSVYIEAFKKRFSTTPYQYMKASKSRKM